MRAHVINGLQSIHHTNKSLRYSEFSKEFECCNLKIAEKHFHRKSQDLHNLCRKKAWCGDQKSKYLQFFSNKNWLTLTKTEKSHHTLHFCEKCSENEEISDLFPDRKKFKPDNQSTPTLQNNISIELPLVEKKNKNLKKYQIEAVSSAITELKKSWETFYDTPFTDIVRKVPGVNLTPRKSRVEKQKNIRNLFQSCKKNIESKWQEQDRDVTTLYGTRQSVNQYDKQRSSLFFESKEKAVERGENIVLQIYSFKTT